MLAPPGAAPQPAAPAPTDEPPPGVPAKPSTGGALLPDDGDDGALLPGSEPAAPDPAAVAGAVDDDEPADERAVDLPGRRPGDPPVRIVADDDETLEALRRTSNGYARREEVQALRQQAMRQLADVEAFNELVEADPAAVVLEALPQVGDKQHMAKWLLTQPGVFTQDMRDWLEAVIDQPAILAKEAQIVNAERVTRTNTAMTQVNARREVQRNAHEIVNETERVLDTLLPRNFDDQTRQLITDDIIADVKRYGKDRGQRLVDPRIVESLAKRRLSGYGVAVAPKNGAREPRPASPAARPAALGGRTPADLQAQRTARRAAAAAPPGLGAPAVQPITLPKGAGIKEAAAAARARLAQLQKPPQ